MEIALVVLGLIFAYLSYRDVSLSRIKVGGRYDKHVEMMSGPKYIFIAIQALVGIVMAVIGAVAFFELATITEDTLRLTLIIGVALFVIAFLAGMILTAGSQNR